MKKEIKKELPDSTKKTPKTNYNRKGNYSNYKNQDPPVKIVEERIPAEQLFPQTTSITPVREFDRPLVKLEEAIEAWEQYQELINALIKTQDIVVVQGVKKAKKSGINKIARFFGYSCEIIRAYKEEFEGPQGGKHFVWRVWAKAIAPTGRFRVAGAACSSTERRFAHLEHDVLATAETRAKKRAIEELAGMGELELLEEEEEETTTQTKTNQKKSEEIPIVEEIDLEKLPIVNKEKAIIAPSGDPLEWTEELVEKLPKVNEKGVPVVYRRKDGQIDYYTFLPMTPEQEKYFDWFKTNTNFKVPDKRRMSRDRASRWLHWAFRFARGKGIKVPQEVEEKISAEEKLREQRELEIESRINYD